MILFYEDEKYYLKEYIETIINEGYEVEIYGDALSFLKRVNECYKDIQLFVIDIMVFGPGNEFKGKNTDGGLKSGLVLLDEIESIEKQYTNIKLKNKIIFTNRTGEIIDNIEKDIRVFKAFEKKDILPSEFVKEIIYAINN